MSSQNVPKKHPITYQVPGPLLPTSRTIQIQYDPCEDSLVRCPCLSTPGSEQCIYFTYLPPSSSSPDILYHPLISSRSLCIFTARSRSVPKIKRHYLICVLENHTTLTLLLYTHVCVVVSEILHKLINPCEQIIFRTYEQSFKFVLSSVLLVSKHLLSHQPCFQYPHCQYPHCSLPFWTFLPPLIHH